MEQLYGSQIFLLFKKSSFYLLLLPSPSAGSPSSKHLNVTISCTPLHLYNNSKQQIYIFFVITASLKNNSKCIFQPREKSEASVQLHHTVPMIFFSTSFFQRVQVQKPPSSSHAELKGSNNCRNYSSFKSSYSKSTRLP